MGKSIEKQAYGDPIDQVLLSHIQYRIATANIYEVLSIVPGGIKEMPKPPATDHYVKGESNRFDSSKIRQSSSGAVVDGKFRYNRNGD